MVTDKGLVDIEHQLFALVVEVSGNKSDNSVCCLTTFFRLFLSLERSLVLVIPRSCCYFVDITYLFAIV